MVASSWAMRFSAFSYSISVRWFTNMPLSLVASEGSIRLRMSCFSIFNFGR